MIQYRYTLDKSSKKFICPRCHKKTFVKYTDSQTGNYLNDNFGRCDRESNCRYHSTPDRDYNNTFEFANLPKTQPSFHNFNLVNQSKQDYSQNNFVCYLKTIFSDYEIEQAIEKYHIGTSKYWDGATVFWQIDNLQKVHHGKILQYNPQTGKRHKNSNGKALIQSVRAVLKIKDFNLAQCLFGLHLISDLKMETLAIVESEKTAVIMSLFKPEYTWLATGGKGFFKYDMLFPIREFKIVAFPDKGEYNHWIKKADELNQSGFKIEVNNWLENSDYENGADLADVYVNCIKA